MQELKSLFQDSQVLQMVVFTLGKEEYCVPIINVQEIIMPQQMTKIPRSPSFIEGVINLRGNIVPVIDGCKRFQVNAEDCIKNKSDERIIVLDVSGHIIGLVVNDVSEVINLTKDQVDINPATTSQDSEFILGIAKVAKRLLIMLNPSKFLEMGEVQSLTNISNTVKELTGSATLNAEETIV